MSLRLIISPSQNGFINMAIDEALFQLLNSEYPLTLRFYSWEPPCITLGYFQKSDEIQYEFLEFEKKSNLTRRITGGSAIYHKGEITLSVVSYDNLFFPRDIGKSYDYMKDALKESFSELGIKLDEVNSDNSSPADNSFCFNVFATSDLFYEGVKVIGMSQKRTGKKWLLHCSIQTSNNKTFLGQIPEEYIKAVKENRRKLQDLIVEKLSNDLGIDFVESALRNDEIKLAESFIEKYQSKEWIYLK